MLAGCDSNPKPAPLPTEGVTSTPASTPSQSPTPPTMPAQAQGTSKAAAKAFVRHWIATLNYAGPSGDTETLADLSSSGCAACQAIIAFIDKVHQNGGDIQGQGWTTKSLPMVTDVSPTQTIVDAIVAVHPQLVRESASASPTEYPGGRRLKTFTLQIHDGSWQVTRLDQPS